MVIRNFLAAALLSAGAIAVSAGTAAAAESHFSAADVADLQRASAYLNSLQSVQGNFVQLAADGLDNYGRLRRKGTPVPVREDFNTLDDPFSWYVDASGVAQQRPASQPGLHFAVFVPTSSKFHAARLAMDGVLPDGTKLPFSPKDRGQGFNSGLTTTHRQNFLVPPRRHRAFPLVELL